MAVPFHTPLVTVPTLNVLMLAVLLTSRLLDTLAFVNVARLLKLHAPVTVSFCERLAGPPDPQSRRTMASLPT